MNGEQIFKSLWEITHTKHYEAIPLKKDTLRLLLEWMAENMKSKLLTRLGISDITTISEKELEQLVEADQIKRTKVRKANQVKYGKSGGKKKAGKVRKMQG